MPQTSVDHLDPDCDARAQLLERLSSGRVALPVMPATAAQVLEDSRQEDSSASRIAEMLESDPALAAHVLRVANSAAYSPPEPIVSLPHAVARMGHTTIGQIALAVCMKGRLFRADGYVNLIAPVWPRSALAAGWAREVAQLRDGDVEGAFLLGLLHDIGRPVVIQALVEIERETKRPFGEQQARMAMDYLHPRVGADLMRRWNMPPSLADGIAWHEDPRSAMEHRDEALTASLAANLADWTLDGDPQDESLVRENEAAPALGMDSSDLDDLLSARERIRFRAEGLA